MRHEIKVVIEEDGGAIVDVGFSDGVQPKHVLAACVTLIEVMGEGPKGFKGALNAVVAFAESSHRPKELHTLTGTAQ